MRRLNPAPTTPGISDTARALILIAAGLALSAAILLAGEVAAIGGMP